MKESTFWVGLGWIMMVAIVTLALVAASWPIVGQVADLAAILSRG